MIAVSHYNKNNPCKLFLLRMLGWHTRLAREKVGQLGTQAKAQGGLVLRLCPSLFHVTLECFFICQFIVIPKTGMRVPRLLGKATEFGA